jgi:hypothetical protein
MRSAMALRRLLRMLAVVHGTLAAALRPDGTDTWI